MFISAIIGVLFAVAFIMIFKKLFAPEYKLRLIDAEVESYGNDSTQGKKGALHNVTLKDSKTGERTLFKFISIPGDIWTNIAAYNLTGRRCIFCAEQNTGINHPFICPFHIFAFKFVDGHGYAFMNDLQRPHSKFRILFNLLWRAYFLYFSFFNILPEAFKTKDNGLFFVSTFLLIVLSHSIYNYLTSLPKRKAILQEQLAMIERAGIPKPLG